MTGYSAIGLVNTKIEANVGGVLRACTCYKVSLVIIQGQRYKRLSSDTTAATRQIPLIQTSDILESIPFDCVPVCVEITEGSRSLFTFQHPKRAIYIFGPEDGSIPKSILEKCQLIVKIPTAYCMNLAATANVILYDRMLKASKNES